MKHSKPSPSLLQRARDRYRIDKKKLHRKRFLIKTKFALTIALPVVVVLLASKVIKTFIHIKIRDLFSKPEEKAEQTDSVQPISVPQKPAAAHMEPVEKTIIQLQTVDSSM